MTETLWTACPPVEAIAHERGTTNATVNAQLGNMRRKTRDPSAALIARVLREAAGCAPNGHESSQRRSGFFPVAAVIPDSVAFSEREREIIDLVKLGRSNKEIAYELGIAHATVGTLQRRAKAKLQLTTPLVPRAHGGATFSHNMIAGPAGLAESSSTLGEPRKPSALDRTMPRVKGVEQAAEAFGAQKVIDRKGSSQKR